MDRLWRFLPTDIRLLEFFRSGSAPFNDEKRCWSWNEGKKLKHDGVFCRAFFIFFSIEANKKYFGRKICVDEFWVTPVLLPIKCHFRMIKTNACLSTQGRLPLTRPQNRSGSYLLLSWYPQERLLTPSLHRFYRSVLYSNALHSMQNSHPGTRED